MPSSSTDISPLPPKVPVADQRQEPSRAVESNKGIRSLSDAWAFAGERAWWVLPGAAQGATTVLLGHPFDTAKTRLQADTEQVKLQTRSSVRVMRQMVKREGFMSLYRGVTPPLAIMGSKRGLQFALWEQLKKVKAEPADAAGRDGPSNSAMSAKFIYKPLRVVGNTIAENNFLSGAVSGGFGTLLGCPMHVIKIQTQNVVAENGAWNAFYCTRDILRRDGPFGLYRGFKFHVLKDVTFAGTYLGMYESLRVSLGDYYAVAAATYATGHQFLTVEPSSTAAVTASAPSAVGSAAMSREHKRSTSPEIAGRSITSPEKSFIANPSSNNVVKQGTIANDTATVTTSSSDTSNEQRQLRARSSNITIFTAGVLASCVTWVVLYPLDTLKTSVQARNAVNFGSFVRLMSANPSAVYRGFSAALIRAGPVSGSAMVAYESTKKWVHGTENDTKRKI